MITTKEYSETEKNDIVIFLFPVVHCDIFKKVYSFTLFGQIISDSPRNDDNRLLDKVEHTDL